jgi:hypothetical protein
MVKLNGFVVVLVARASSPKRTVVVKTTANLLPARQLNVKS